jgi:hypothetical protein
MDRWRDHDYPEWPEGSWGASQVEHQKAHEAYFRKELADTLPFHTARELRVRARVYKRTLEIRAIALIGRPMVEAEFRRRALAAKGTVAEVPS